ncbi:MAG TPA: metal-dependent transcriptional regulator [Gemmatimonadota bacterium]|nr:metal-dependent transcriptional regulator [Gemmatimonadota bacterium]
MPSRAMPEVTPPIEDYLKSIYMLGRESDGRASTSAIAERMDVSAASATNMMQRLAEMKLADYVPYKGVSLTDAGEKIALEVIRHHRLIELYLAEALGYAWDEVHEEAERLEHVISEEFEDRIDAMLGHPTTDPHGDPIPPKTGAMRERPLRPLSEARPGERVVVLRVGDRDPSVLRRLAELGLVPGAAVEVTGTGPPGSMITMERDGEPFALDAGLAAHVFIESRG